MKLPSTTISDSPVHEVVRQMRPGPDSPAPPVIKIRSCELETTDILPFIPGAHADPRALRAQRALGGPRSDIDANAGGGAGERGPLFGDGVGEFLATSASASRRSSLGRACRPCDDTRIWRRVWSSTTSSSRPVGHEPSLGSISPRRMRCRPPKSICRILTGASQFTKARGSRCRNAP